MDKLQIRLPAGYAPDTPVLAAFSGGADSTLLLHLLHRLSQENHSPLYAVHVHHGIRGKEADADLNFCRQTCRKLKVSLFVIRVNVPALAKKQGKSLEEAARDARYRHFARLMRTHHIPLLATAHHADDNLETLLFRLARGTGTAGMKGIPAYAPLPGTDTEQELHLFRPLLHLSKQEILDACQRLRLCYVTDATNACDDYARNRIRNHVIPELEKLFPHPQHAAARTCRAAAEDCDALDSIASMLYAKHAAHNALPLSLLREQPPAIAKRLILRLYDSFVKQHRSQPCGRPEAVHLDAVYARVCANQIASISLPGRIAAVTDRDVLRITEDACAAKTDYFVPLNEGWTEIDAAGVAIWAHFPQNQKTDTCFDTNVYNLYTELQVRFDTIKGQAFLRPIREGDVILHGGMHKKIRKLYGHAGVPLYLRTRLPLLCDADGVIAVPGICIRDGAAAAAEDQTLYLRICLQNHFDT